MLLSSRSMNLGKDPLTNSIGDVVPNVGSPLQAASPLLGRGDTEMLLKVLFFTINLGYISKYSCSYICCGCVFSLTCLKMFLYQNYQKHHGLSASKFLVFIFLFFILTSSCS